MLSHYLRTATRLTFRSFSRISINNFNKHHFEKSIIQFHRWESMYISHKPYTHDLEKGSKNPLSNTLNQQTRDKDYNPSSRPSQPSPKSTEFENMPFNQTLSKVPYKHPYGSERKDERHDDNPMDVMNENVAKDEETYPRDRHFNQDSVSPSASTSATSSPTSKDRQLGKDNLYDMTLIQNEPQHGTNTSTSNAGDKTRQPTDINKNKVEQNHDFQKLNRDENFNDVYVGDVEHKIPTKNLNAHHKQVVAQHMKHKDVNKEQETTSAQSFGKRSNVENETQYSVDDHENHDKSLQQKKGSQQKSKMMENDDNFDLSSGSFSENMKEYEKKMKNDETMAYPNLEKTPSNQDYYLKDNNSEYNKFMSDDKNKNRKEDRENNNNKNKINKNKRSDDQYSKSSKHDDSETYHESDDSKYNDSSRNKQM